ncbi:MAG TPA: CoA transferase [Alphaproteobacteria bacterium]|nr:CoA transferase [Alphaproteobacteria bacterium]
MTVSGPLAGVLVLDLTRVLAGPFATMILADLGARVVKVEPPGGDDSRGFGPFANGKSAYFASLNRGKESIALDLKSASDRAIFERLIERADVLVENYRSGTMEKLGYGFESLHARHPRLIYAACSGFGHSGPYAGRPAYDLVVQAMGGIMSLTGHPGGPPTRVGTSIGDIAAGLFTAIGIATALYRRALDGVGMKIDVAMLDSQIAILENAIARYVTTGEVPGPIGARHPSIAPFEAYRARDVHLVVAAGNDALFAKLAGVIGRPELAREARFRDNESRVKNVAALKQEIETALARESAAHWLAVLEREGIPCGPINTVAQALEDPQVKARRMVVVAEDPASGPLRMAGNPIKFSNAPDPETRPPAPELDAQREAILESLED